MAGRFSFSVPERRHAGDPWFRVGQLDVNTTVLIAGLCVLSMFVWAADPDALRALVLLPDDVKGGQVWRLLTWPLANEPSIWTAITVAIFWYFGREIEGLLGRVKFAALLTILAVVPGLVATVLDIPVVGIRPLEFGVFLIFIAEYPYARFFFGIPAWVLGAVFVGIEVLQLMGLRREDEIVLLFVSIAVAAVAARSMGLAQSLPWIPALPIGGGGGSGRPPGSGGRSARPARRRDRGGGDVVAGPWSAAGRGGPTRAGAPLPQPPVSPDMIADQAALDALLDKIAAGGMDSLSGDEKRRLNDLSKRMRGNRR